MRVMARFKPITTHRHKLNTRQEKLRMAFNLYDIDGELNRKTSLSCVTQKQVFKIFIDREAR